MDLFSFKTYQEARRLVGNTPALAIWNHAKKISRLFKYVARHAATKLWLVGLDSSFSTILYDDGSSKAVATRFFAVVLLFNIGCAQRESTKTRADWICETVTRFHSVEVLVLSISCGKLLFSWFCESCFVKGKGSIELIWFAPFWRWKVSIRCQKARRTHCRLNLLTSPKYHILRENLRRHLRVL